MTNNQDKTKKVALLGGSFDPAHAGHLAISMLALHLLPVDEVWWLVTPQNNLKDKTKFSFEERLLIAESVSQDSKIKVVDFEKNFPQSSSFQTVTKLQQEFPQINFLWLIGADCFAQLHQWNHWRELTKLLPLVVVARPGYTEAALSCCAAKELARISTTSSDQTLFASQAKKIWTTLPSWIFINEEVANLSSTEINQ